MSKIVFIAFIVSQLFSPKLSMDILRKPALNKCISWHIIGKTKHKRPIWMLHIKGTSNKTIMVTSGIHGDEKYGVVAAVNLAVNLCSVQKKMQYSAVIIPVMNPDGYSGKYKYHRSNGCGRDINRDGFRWKTPAGRAFMYQFLKWNPIRYVDLHMTGQVVLAPRPWTRAYHPSRKFAKRLQRLGIKGWVLRNGLPRRMLYSWASEQGVPSVLIEIGYRGDHVKYAKSLQRKRTTPVVRALINLFTTKGLVKSPIASLRKGSTSYRLYNYELSLRSKRPKFRRRPSRSR